MESSDGEKFDLLGTAYFHLIIAPDFGVSNLHGSLGK
jgi:hypothetical protein